jgi:serine-type D-Ala-D-Ala carboxypeptidase/endopeptidase (penicillin-binding protein 4)
VRALRFTWRWIVPVLLLLAASTSVVVGLRIDREAAEPGTAALRQGRVATPVLSARRIPSVVAEPVALRRLQADLGEWIGLSPADSCLMVNQGNGAAVFEHRIDAPVVPASAQKLLTATSTLLELGPDHTFRTVVAAERPDGEVVAGDLFLVGGGDPLLASPDYAARFPRQPQLFTDLDELAGEVAGAGIQRIEGSVVGDEGRYDRVRYVPGWPSRYIDQDQIGPLSALAVNDGFARYPTRDEASEPLEQAEDPAANAASVLTRLLRDRGVEVIGEARAGDAPDGVDEIAWIESPPVVDVVGQLLAESDNNTGELLLKEVGLARRGQGSTPAGAAATEALLRRSGGPAEGIEVADGSGLSLDNRVTCELLVELLERQRTGPLLVDGLAVAGETGTLELRFGGDMAGRLRGKTGSLNTVTSLSGVLDDDDGRLTFAYVANVDEPATIGSSTIALQDSLAQILLDWPRTPEVSVLGPRPAEVPDATAPPPGS